MRQPPSAHACYVPELLDPRAALSLYVAGRQRGLTVIDVIRIVLVWFLTVAERLLTHPRIVDGPWVRP
jgi:hypothetical protein